MTTLADLAALAVGMPSGMELGMIFLVILLLFGGRKLPELARSMGASLNAFKKGLKEEPGETGELAARKTDDEATKGP
jgi:sec-independent protein translocase protein TatA